LGHEGRSGADLAAWITVQRTFEQPPIGRRDRHGEGLGLDSLTQLALGAAVGEATLGRRVGNRAILWGAICGTIPDLDVFVPLGGPVADFTYHRSFSHSLFVLAALTPLVVWLILRIHPRTRQARGGWLLMVYLVFATHVLLDSFTVYGTQIFWPLVDTPMTWSTIFIIDPLYTLPLIAGVTGALVATRDASWGRRLNGAGLALSTAYLAWSLGAKLHVENVARESLRAQGIAYRQLLTTPSPFNTLLWRIVATDEQGYYEGFYSLLDEDRDIRTQRYASRPSLLQGLERHWPVARLQWFTKGLYSVSQRGDDVVMTDLRMGLEPDYVFRFKVAEIGNPHPRPVPDQRIEAIRDLSRLKWIWARIWQDIPEQPRVPASTTAATACDHPDH
jgi:inner membrane protein